MPVFPEETAGISTRDRTMQPPDLLARSGLPVPQWSEKVRPEDFNADMSRLVTRIQSLFALLAPTPHGTEEAAQSLVIVSHAPQHQVGGGDEINVTDLSGRLQDDQPPEPHVLVSARHTASGLTIGHVLRAFGPNDFDFQAIELTDVPASLRTEQFIFTLRRNEITAAEKDVLHVTRRAQLLSWVVASDTVANIQFDIWRSNGAVPTSSAQSIIGAGNKPKLVAQNLRQELPSGWTAVDFNVNDIIVLNVDSNSGFNANSVVTLGLVVIQTP